MRYTILFCLCCLPYCLLAQTTYIQKIGEGRTAYNGGRYEEAIKHFLDAVACKGYVGSAEQEKEIKSWTDKCYVAIRAEAAAEAAWQMALELNRSEPYDYVIKSFPNTPQAGAARKKIAELPPVQLCPYTETVNGVSFTMIPIKGGTFTMGCTDEQKDCGGDEKPPHPVTLSDYALGQTEVTQALWRAVMGSNPSYLKNCDECPVDRVSWNDVDTFLQKLNQKTCHTYRLPTEAEWEYAAREGGKKVLFGNGKNIADPAQMNFKDSAAYKKDYSLVGKYRGMRTPEKTFAPNALGLYDMAGNVWECCQDWYGSDYYQKSPKKNPTGPDTGSYRVFRGGSWYSTPQGCRVAFRSYFAPGDRYSNVGFRLASQ